MRTLERLERARRRAADLNGQAANCVTFAVSERDVTHAAELIDEALRLRKRAAELAEA